MSTLTDGHILKRFDNDLAKLEGKVIDMGLMVREQLQRICMALEEGGGIHMEEVIEEDRPIDLMERKTDKNIVQVLARRAPVGSDLRFIVGISRMVTDLERMGDEVAQMAKALMNQEGSLEVCQGVSARVEVESLSRMTQSLFERVMEAFREHELDVATEIASGRSGADGELAERLERLNQCAMTETKDVTGAVNLVLAARSLHRLRMHIRNISEHVVYFISGKDLRHKQDLA